MAETRRKLDSEHRSFDGTGIAGFLIFGFGAFLWLVMMVWNPSTSSQADYAGLAFLTGLTVLACWAIGGLLSFGTLFGGNRVNCHCAKCCGNTSEDGSYCNGHGQVGYVYYDDAAKVKEKIEEEKKLLNEGKNLKGRKLTDRRERR